MKNEVERLLNGRGLEVKNNKNLTENLREWRKTRNITKADYLTFVGNVLEELLEPLYGKKEIELKKKDILMLFFPKYLKLKNEIDILDAIKDIKVFCINETELMGYDDIKTDNEVFKHINCRKQDTKQKEEWIKNGAIGKWQKDQNQPKDEIYEPNYESCKLWQKN